MKKLQFPSGKKVKSVMAATDTSHGILQHRHTESEVHHDFKADFFNGIG